MNWEEQTGGLPFEGALFVSDGDDTCHRKRCTVSGSCTVRSDILAAVSRKVRTLVEAWNLFFGNRYSIVLVSVM